MWIKHIIVSNTRFKGAASIVACVIIATFLSRSFVVRPSERLQRIHSILSESANQEINLDDHVEGENKSFVLIGKRIRDDYPCEKKLRCLIVKGDLSDSTWLEQSRRFAFFERKLEPTNHPIKSLEKPPKV